MKLPDVPVKDGGLVYRVLRHPLHTTANRQLAEFSRWTYRENGDGTYSTSLLGVANGLVGLRIKVVGR